MLKIEKPLQYLEIIQHPHHFYEFIFKPSQSARLAFDEWLFYVEQFYQMPPHTPVKLLTDSRQIGSIPLAYAFRKSQPMLRKYSNPPNPRSVFVSAESQGVVDKMLQTFIQLLGVKADLRYLYGDKRDEAIDFLFANEPENHPNQVKI